MLRNPNHRHQRLACIVGCISTTSRHLYFPLLSEPWPVANVLMVHQLFFQMLRHVKHLCMLSCKSTCLVLFLYYSDIPLIDPV